ncbi:MAG: beta-galactosidase [Anaerolineae bacterium]
MKSSTCLSKAPFLWHGGDYNPEQWSRDIWQEDFRLMRQAGITATSACLTRSRFSRPRANSRSAGWTRSWTGLRQRHPRDLATQRGAAAWMSAAYPQMLRSDARGVRHRTVGASITARTPTITAD